MFLLLKNQNVRQGLAPLDPPGRRLFCFLKTYEIRLVKITQENGVFLKYNRYGSGLGCPQREGAEGPRAPGTGGLRHPTVHPGPGWPGGPPTAPIPWGAWWPPVYRAARDGAASPTRSHHPRTARGRLLAETRAAEQTCVLLLKTHVFKLGMEARVRSISTWGIEQRPEHLPTIIEIRVAGWAPRRVWATNLCFCC